MIRIFLIDDHTLFRSGLCLLLRRQPDFEVVGEAADGVEGVKRACELQPDVVLLDLNMPGCSGLEVLQILTQELPQCAVVVLTVSEEGEELAQALRKGARGYLLKNIYTETLVSAIRQAAAGEPVIAPGMTGKLVEQFCQQTQPEQQACAAAGAERDRLTPREAEVVRQLVRGASNKEIARALEVTESTVKIHVQNVLKKLNLHSRVQVAVYAVEHGLGDEAPG